MGGGGGGRGGGGKLSLSVFNHQYPLTPSPSPSLYMSPLPLSPLGQPPPLVDRAVLVDDTCKHLSKVHHLLMAERQRADTTLPLDLWKRSVSRHPHIQTLSCHLVTFSLLSLHLPITPSIPIVTFPYFTLHTVPSHPSSPLTLFLPMTPSLPLLVTISRIIPFLSLLPTVTISSHHTLPPPSYPLSLFHASYPSSPSSPVSLFLPITPATKPYPAHRPL